MTSSLGVVGALTVTPDELVSVLKSSQGTNVTFVALVNRGCRFCMKLKSLLKKHDMKLLSEQDTHSTFQQELKTRYHHFTYPMVFVHVKKTTYYVGGFTETEHLLNSG